MNQKLTLNEAMHLLLNIAGESYTLEEINEHDRDQLNRIADYFRNEARHRAFSYLEPGEVVSKYMALHLQSEGGEGEGDSCETNIVIFERAIGEIYQDLIKRGDPKINDAEALTEFLTENAAAIVCMTGSYDSYEGFDWSNGEIGLATPGVVTSVVYYWA